MDHNEPQVYWFLGFLICLRVDYLRLKGDDGLFYTGLFDGISIKNLACLQVIQILVAWN